MAWKPSVQDHAIEPLIIDEGAQLDTILPWLALIRSSQYYIHTHETTESNVFTLSALDIEPDLADQTKTRKLIHLLILRTIEGSVFRPRLRSVHEAAVKLMNGMHHTAIKTDEEFLRVLGSIGAVLLRATTADRYERAPAAPPKTPTECLAGLLSALDSNLVPRPCSQRVQAAVDCVREQGQNLRLECAVDIESVASLLDSAQTRLESADAAGLGELCERIRNMAKGLRSFGPGGPPVTRLVDNVFGRVWESALNDALVVDMPPRVFSSAHVMRRELTNIVDNLPGEVQQRVYLGFTEHVKAALPRPWSGWDKRLVNLCSIHEPTKQQVRRFLGTRSTTGYEVLGDFFVVLSMFVVMKTAAPDHSSWIHAAKRRYEDDIVPLRGRQRFVNLLPGHLSRASGITLAHQPPACVGNDASLRPVLVNACDLDLDPHPLQANDTSSVNNMLSSLKRGLPYATGISGSTHLLASFFAHIKKGTSNIEKELVFDVRHAVLGLLVFLVYDGGHSWNEGLQVVHYLEGKLELGVLDSESCVEDPCAFVANYSRFISRFSGTETELLLGRAVQHANREAVLYHENLQQHIM